jgi:formate-dependent nitrite reductase membrane component NrfD
MTILFACADLFLGIGEAFWLCPLVALIALGAGSGLLIFELGRPWQFWRVFSRQTAVLTFGAWMVGILVVADAAYFSCWLSFLPWAGIWAVRSVTAVVAMLLGFGVLLYTGVELASMKARVFWNTPALPMVFALSGLLSGCGANCLVLFALPPSPFAHNAAAQVAMALVGVAILQICLTALCVAALLATMLYVLMMYSSVTPGSRKVALRWLKGRYAAPFWCGLVLAGHVLPLLLLAFGASSPATVGVAAAAAIVGGVFMRFLVVHSDDRRMIEDEAAYLARLPKGDEEFLKRNWG